MRTGQNRGAGQSTDYGYPNTYGRRLTPRPLFMPIVRIGFSGRVYFRISRSTAPCRNPHHLFPLIRFYGPCPASAGAGCGGRLRARSYRLRVAVVFVHAFGFELVAGGFEASLGFARLCSSSRVFEGLSAFRSADALRFGYHIPATAPNPQTRFALAHRASRSHGPFKRHEEPLLF